ncbi:MAG: hypothetical protein L0H70_00940 [Xanthomonadales bacterium]|nr:hypothetical protein [Xanthomonadales bacterium]
MKNHKTSRTRTLLFLTLAAAAMGSAQAADLEIGQVNQATAAAGTAALSFTISNTGAAASHNVRAFVGGMDAVVCAGATAQGQAFARSGALGAGDSVQCTGRYVATSAGRRTSNITVLGQDNQGHLMQHSMHQTSVAAAAAAVSNSAVGVLAGAVYVDADSDQAFDVGESISFNYTVYNLGTTALSGLAVTYEIATGPVSGTATCPGTTLAAGASMVCTSSHTLTAADVNGVFLNNTASVAGTGGSQAVAGEDAILVTGSSANSPNIRMLKNPLLGQDNNGDGVPTPGDLVAYTFVVKNSGPVPMTDISIVEPDPSRLDPGSPITCSATTTNGVAFAGNLSGVLAHGDSVLCTANYTLADTDAAAGKALNEANVTGIHNVTASGSASSKFVAQVASPLQALAPVPVNDWRALLLLGLGLLGAGFALTYRKRQRS